MNFASGSVFTFTTAPGILYHPPQIALQLWAWWPLHDPTSSSSRWFFLSYIISLSGQAGNTSLVTQKEACDWWTGGCTYTMLFLVELESGHDKPHLFSDHISSCFSGSLAYSRKFLLIYSPNFVTKLGLNKSLPWMIFHCLLWSFTGRASWVGGRG